jgi:hypothetical protein
MRNLSLISSSTLSRIKKEKSSFLAIFVNKQEITVHFWKGFLNNMAATVFYPVPPTTGMQYHRP